MLTLILLNKTGKPTRYILNGHEPEVIGRHARRLKVEDKQISRRHAEIALENGVWILRDLGSKNGTFINGELVKGIAELEAGDEIKIGRFSFVIGHVDVDLGEDDEQAREQASIGGSAAATLGPAESAAIGEAVADDDEDDDEDDFELEVDNYASQVRSSLTRSDPQLDWLDDDAEDPPVVPIAMPNFPRPNPDAPEASNEPLEFNSDDELNPEEDASLEASLEASGADEAELDSDQAPAVARPDSPLELNDEPEAASEDAALLDANEPDVSGDDDAISSEPESIGIDDEASLSSGFDAIADEIDSASSGVGMESLDAEIAESIATDDFQGMGDIATSDGSSADLEIDFESSDDLRDDAGSDQLELEPSPQLPAKTVAEKPSEFVDTPADSVARDDSDESGEQEPVELVGLSLDQAAPIDVADSAKSGEGDEKAESAEEPDLLDIEDFESWLEDSSAGSSIAVDSLDTVDAQPPTEEEHSPVLDQNESDGPANENDDDGPAAIFEDELEPIDDVAQHEGEPAPEQDESSLASAIDQTLPLEVAPTTDPAEPKGAFDNDLTLPEDADEEEAKRLLDQSLALDKKHKKKSRKFWGFAAILLVAGGIVAMYFSPLATGPWQITGRTPMPDRSPVGDDEISAGDTTASGVGEGADTTDATAASADSREPGSDTTIRSGLGDPFSTGPNLLSESPDTASVATQNDRASASTSTTETGIDSTVDATGSTDAGTSNPTTNADASGAGESGIGVVAMVGDGEGGATQTPSGIANADADPTKVPGTDHAAMGDGRQVVYLVDASGSMVDSMSDGVLSWLDNEIGALQPDDQFTVLFFRTDLVLEVPPAGLKTADRPTRNATQQWINPSQGHIRPQEKSDPILGIETAISYKPKEIVIISDNLFGRHSATEADFDAFELSRLISPDAVEINTVQFFYKDPDGRLEAIADTFGGSFEFVPERIYEDELGELLGEAGTGL